MSTLWDSSRLEDGHELANLDVHTWQNVAQSQERKI